MADLIKTKTFDEVNKASSQTMNNDQIIQSGPRLITEK
jgi:hypothetical protein